MLHVKSGLESDFEAAFKKASKFISSMDGYLFHELHKCIEVKGKYLLLVKWENLEAHTVVFRGSAEFQEWKKLLHHFMIHFPLLNTLKKLKYEKQDPRLL